MHDSDPTSRTPLQKSSAATTSLKDKIPTPAAGEDDYVWDVFYHRPATLSEWNAVAANVGTVYALPCFFPCKSLISRYIVLGSHLHLVTPTTRRQTQKKSSMRPMRTLMVSSFFFFTS